MSVQTIQIVDQRLKRAVDAELHEELRPEELVEIETAWAPARLAGTRRLLREGVPEEKIPRHWHWDWRKKEAKLKLLAHRFFGIVCEKQFQGLLMTTTIGHVARTAPDVAKPLVYINYIESAPW